MADADKMFYAGHRERLKQKLQDDKLTSYEKLELLLTYAIPRRDVRPLARALINQFGGVYFVLTAPYEDLVRVNGVGHNTALLIRLVSELMLVSYRERVDRGQSLLNPVVLQEYCRRLVVGKPVEEFHVLYFGNEMRLLDDELHSRGTIDYSDVYPREILRRALALNAINVVLVHNHPLSDNSFSTEDVALTEAIEKKLNEFNIGLWTHYVVTSTGIVHDIRASAWLNKSSFFYK